MNISGLLPAPRVAVIRVIDHRQGKAGPSNQFLELELLDISLRRVSLMRIRVRIIFSETAKY